MGQQEPTVTMSVRMSAEATIAIDARSKELEAEHGTPFSRADVIRMAVAQYLGLATPNGEPTETDQPQATP